MGLSVPAGEAGHSAVEQIWARPTCEINGIWGGYTGAGFKTVLPAEARAKLTFRLVGDQDPERIMAGLEAQVRAGLPADCKVHFRYKTPSRATLLPSGSEDFARARSALSEEWPKPAVFVGSRGSIPVVGHFQRILELNALMIGFGQNDDAIHSPNEKYDLASFRKGARSWARVLAALTDTNGKGKGRET